MRSSLAAYIFLALFTTLANAATHECKVEWAAFASDNPSDGFKIAGKDYIRNMQLIVRITDGNTSKLERCSFVESQNRSTCDAYEVDVVSSDKNIGMHKFYVTRSQYDIQIVTSRNGTTTFIENNGRGGIATGTCEIVKP